MINVQEMCSKVSVTGVQSQSEVSPGTHDEELWRGQAEFRKCENVKECTDVARKGIDGQMGWSISDCHHVLQALD